MKRKKAINKVIDIKKSTDRTNRKKKLKRLLLLALSFIVIFGIYTAGCRLELKAIVTIYFGLLLALIIAFIILNRGIDTEPPEYDMLPEDWDGEKRTRYIDNDAKRRKIARMLLYAIIPLLITFAVDLVYLAFFAGSN